MRPTAAIVLVMLVAAACAQENGMSASIEEVRARYTDELMATPGVVSVGVGQDEDGTPVIIIGLDRAATQVQVPGTLDGIEVRTQVVGTVRSQ